MLDSRSTKANIRNLAILTRPFPTFLRKISPPRNLLFHNGRTMSADFICGIRYTRDNAANFVSSMITRLQRLFRARTLFICHGIMRLFSLNSGLDICLQKWPLQSRRCVPKVIVNIGIRFRSTVCYLIRSKLISKISGDEKYKNKYYYIFLYGYYSIYDSILDNYLNYFLIDFIKRINTVVYLSYGRFFNSGWKLDLTGKCKARARLMLCLLWVLAHDVHKLSSRV